MIRGTTPTHTFKIPFDASVVKSAMVIYAQDGMEVLHKETEDCELEGKTIKTKLSQEDTFKFSHTANVQIQLRLLTMSGDALVSDIKTVSVEQCLNNEVLA